MLTDEIRAYLRASLHGALLYDVTLGLIKRFELTPEEAGEVIVSWIRETA
jgi:hypothetical protein